MIHGARAQIRAIPHVEAELCLCCTTCFAKAVCRSKALIRIDPAEPPFVDVSRCYGCDLCVQACPSGAIRLINS